MQGGGIEESCRWARDEPLTASEALDMLGLLANRLSENERQRRGGAIACARTYINLCRNAKGVNAQVSKSCQVRGDRENRRVDIEVSAGKAFVP
jgi:hypothetical protein